jgi:hypothetical protein
MDGRPIMNHPLRPGMMAKPVLGRVHHNRHGNEGRSFMARTNGKKISYHQRIIGLLADGEWHSLKEIHKAVARFIDADTADVEYRRRHAKWEQEKPAARVAAGKKRLIFLSLNTAIHHRKLVVARGRDWEREYRLTKEALASRRAAEQKAEEARQEDRR